MCYASCATFRRIPVSLILRDVSSHLQFNLLLKYRPNFNDQSLKKVEYIYLYIYIYIYIHLYLYIYNMYVYTEFFLSIYLAMYLSI